MLTDEQIAEVVAFDRRVRGGYRRRNGRKMPRITNRYNYIVPCDSRVKSLSEVLEPDRPKEVCIVNVAVKPGLDDVPVVREVVWMWPETGRIEVAGCHYKGRAGWVVEWAWKDLRRRKDQPRTPWRRARYLTKTTERYSYRCGCPGLCRSYDATVNPYALAETRYKYCQYADELKCKTGLMEWLSLYRDEPKVELLAKCGLYCFVCPAGLKALEDKRVFAWAKDNAELLRKYSYVPINYALWAARHGSTLEDARRHYDLVHNLCHELDSVRYHLRIGGYDGRGLGRRENFKLKLDYERLAGLLKKWHVDAYEYGRYIEHAFDLGYDLRNEGTLYPPTRGGRKAFMARLEELEKECARQERIRERAEEKRRKAAAKAEKEWIAKTMKVRFKEIEAFQKSLKRTETLRGCGYTLVLAKTQKELRAEGRRMGNCVGNGTYGRGIIEGDNLIVMLGLGGKSYCDIEIDRRNWRVNQCYLKGNTTPPEEVRELAAQIAAFLKDEHRRHRKAGLFNVPRRKAA